MPNLKQIFGSQLRAARKCRHWTQTELASKAGLSMEMIGMLERGQAAPSLATIEKLSDSLGVRCTSLLDEPAAADIPDHDRVRIIQRIIKKVSEAPETKLVGLERVIGTLLDVMSHDGASVNASSDKAPVP